MVMDIHFVPMDDPSFEVNLLKLHENDHGQLICGALVVIYGDSSTWWTFLSILCKVVLGN